MHTGLKRDFAWISGCQLTGSNGFSPHIVQIFLNAEKIRSHSKSSPITLIASEAAPKEIPNACEELLKNHKVTNQQQM